MVGTMRESDFTKDTITFHMPATYYAAAGRYIIEPEGDWVRRKEQLAAHSQSVQKSGNDDVVPAWPKWVQTECLAVLRNVDTQLRATGRVSARVERLIGLLAGMHAIADTAEEQAHA